ncbi:MAG: response regulator [Gammaproteobacteria bacterium]|nr:response regulator [Gammaproteobacteria bacterium]
MKYILAADDEPVNREIIEEILADDYEVVCVEDGLQCLQSIAKRVPDMLLLDVAMPVMDGFEVCKKLRSETSTRDLPIFMVSGFASTEHINKGLQAGANKYITKPFIPCDLLKALDDFFRNI